MRSPEVEEMKEVEEIKESRSSILGNQVQMQNPHPEKSKGAAPKRKPCHGGRGGARERFVSGRVWLLTMGLRVRLSQGRRRECASAMCCKCWWLRWALACCWQCLP